MANERYNDGSIDQSIAQYIADHERRIKDLESGNRAGQTSVDDGSFTIKNGSLTVGPNTQIYMGPVSYGSDTSYGWIFNRSTGVNAFVLAGSSNDDQYWSLNDSINNIIVGDDAGANQGLARPWIPMCWGPGSTKAFVAAEQTTSTSFSGVLLTQYRKQHPRIYMEYLLQTGATSPGEWQVFDQTHNTIIAGPFSIIASQFVSGSQTFDIPGSHMDNIQLEIQTRLTSGTNAFGFRMLSSYGVQS